MTIIELPGTYFNVIMFMVASSVVTTILILNYHHRAADTHEMPEWVRLLFLRWIPWLLRMSRPGMDLSLKSIMMERRLKEGEEKDRVSKTFLITNVLCVEDDFMLKSPPFSDPVHFSQKLPLIPNGFHHKRYRISTRPKIYICD